MPLIQVNADFTKVARSLERIAEALERAFPSQEVPSKEYLDVKDLHSVNEWPAFDKEDREEWESYGPRRYE